MALPSEVPRIVQSEPDPEILAAAISGDRDAQGAIARLYYARMRRWALLETGDRSLADDVVQEALVRWVRYAHTCRADAPFAPWLRTLVRNAARDRRRARPGVLRFLPWVQAPPRPDRLVDLSRTAERILALVQQLSPRQRELVDLCVLQGLSAVDAADRLDLSPNTARVHLHEGRKRLMRLLEEADLDLRELREAVEE